MRFEGKVVIVTGAGSGIGKATTELFAAEGAKIVAGEIDQARLDTLVAELKAKGTQIVGVQGNVAKDEDCKKLVDAAVKNFGTLDVLVLKTLSWGPMHGYGVGRWNRQPTDEALSVQEGALYPALHRLQRKGWLEEDWGLTDTGREAKYYRLTPVGRRQLRTEIARWRAYAAAVGTALDAVTA